MHNVVAHLQSLDISNANMLANMINQQTSFVGDKMLMQDEANIIKALDKFKPFVDFDSAQYGVHYRLIPVIDPFSFEPAVVADLSYQSMVEYLVDKNIIVEAKFAPIFEGDELTRDVGEGTFRVKRNKASTTITQACIGLSLPNGEIAFTLMPISELQECETLARKKVYGGHFPYDNLYEFYAQCVLRRALNEHDILINDSYDAGDAGEVTTPLINLHIDYYKRFDAMEAHYQSESVVIKKSFAVSKQPSKSVAFLNQLNKAPTKDTVVELKKISDDDDIDRDALANSW